MTDEPTRYPLAWPVGWPRRKAIERERARFGRRGEPRAGGGWRPLNQISVSAGLARLDSEARAFTRPGRAWRIDPDRIIVSTNVPTRRDGLPSGNHGEPADPGVAVYFDFDGKPCVLACDKWDRVADNLAAIAAHLGVIRAMERWGVGRLSQAFTGYLALPAPGGSEAETWWRVLGVAHDAPLEVIKEAYRTAARKAHPDAGGSSDTMARVNAAWDQARKAFGP